MSRICVKRPEMMFVPLLFSLVASTIGTKPEFRIPLVNTTVEAGKYLYIVCEAEGQPPISYKWYNDHEDEITKDVRQPVYARAWGNDSALFFKNVSYEYEGSYTCVATNDHGLASKVFFLRVLPPSGENDTDIDKGNGTSRIRSISVLRVTTRSVTFNITTSGPIEYIEVKYSEGKLASNATTVRFAKVSVNQSYEIGNLIPSGLYIFQFRAMPGDWSEKYNVTLLPDSPEIILQIVGNRSVRLMWFTRTDDILRKTIDGHQIKYFRVEIVAGNYWTSWNCPVTIEVPTCVGSSYTIWGLERMIFYQMEVRAHTKAGYGEPWRQKIYLP